MLLVIYYSGKWLLIIIADKIATCPLLKRTGNNKMEISVIKMTSWPVIYLLKYYHLGYRLFLASFIFSFFIRTVPKRNRRKSILEKYIYIKNHFSTKIYRKIKWENNYRFYNSVKKYALQYRNFFLYLPKSNVSEILVSVWAPPPTNQCTSASIIEKRRVTVSR